MKLKILKDNLNNEENLNKRSEQLKDLEILSFEEWRDKNQKMIRKSIGITGNEMAIELNLYTKYKKDQLLNL